MGAIALGPSNYGVALERDGTVIGWDNANVPGTLGKVSAVAAGSFGAVIEASSALPKLEIRAADAAQGFLHVNLLPDGFILEVADEINTPFAPAPAGIRLDQLFTFSKPHQFFRLHKAP